MNYSEFIEYFNKGGGFAEHEVNAMRHGQLLFNTLVNVNPEVAAWIRGSIFDPFYKDINSINPDTFVMIEEKWEAFK